MDQKQFPAGTVIFKEGDPGDAAFLIASGVIEITRDVGGKATVLGESRSGQIFGEMALISDQPRTATATAKEDTTCFVVPPVVFETEINGASALMKAMVHKLVGHIRSLMGQLESMSAKPKVEFFDADKAGTYRRRE